MNDVTEPQDGEMIEMEPTLMSPPDGGQQQEEESSEQGGQKNLRVGIVGTNTVARATNVAYDTKGAERKIVGGIEDLDSLIDWKPNVVFLCTELSLLKNDTLDDAELVNIVNKIVRTSGAGVCIRTTINIETIERLIQAIGWEQFQAKVMYNPVMGDADSMADILTPDVEYFGGDEKAIQAHVNILKHLTHFSATTIVPGTVFEVAYAKMAVAGFKAVKQTYFNQLQDAVLECGGANPVIVRRMIEQAPDLLDRSVMIPTYVRARVNDELTYKQSRSFSGEFENADVKMFVGMTDKLPLLDECINFKNLKG